MVKDSTARQFAFESESWKKLFRHTYTLTSVFRQADPSKQVLCSLGFAVTSGAAFVRILNSMRVGELDEECVARIRALERPLSFTDGVEVTEL